MKNRISSVDVLINCFPGSLGNGGDPAVELSAFAGALPYYLSLIDFENHRKSPIFKQSFPASWKPGIPPGKLIRCANLLPVQPVG
jgi:hypothetical protein